MDVRYLIATGLVIISGPFQSLNLDILFAQRTVLVFFLIYLFGCAGS